MLATFASIYLRSPARARYAQIRWFTKHILRLRDIPVIEYCLRLGRSDCPRSRGCPSAVGPGPLIKSKGKWERRRLAGLSEPLATPSTFGSPSIDTATAIVLLDQEAHEAHVCPIQVSLSKVLK